MGTELIGGIQLEPVVPTIVGVIVWFPDVIGEKVSSTLKSNKHKNLLFLHTNDPNTTTFQVPILNNNSDCQILTNETIQSSMLCAGGEGRGTNKVR